jgi:molybdopterin converting factor small subunit
MVFHIKILYFAKIKELLKKTHDYIDVESSEFSYEDIFELVKKINVEKLDELSLVFTSCLISINDEYVDRSSKIQINDNAEISILPPISAG